MRILASGNEGWIALVAIIVVAGLMAGLAFLIHRIIKNKSKGEEKPDDETILKEEMDRVLEPINDEEVAKEISEYQEDE